MISLFGPKIGTILNIILVLGFLGNLVLAFILIFLERNRRSASSTWAWIFVLFVLPVLGFILYLFFGRTVSKRKMEKNNGKELDVYKDLIDEQAHKIDHHNYHTENKQLQNHQDMARMLLKKQDAFITEDNKIDLFIDGHELYDKVLEDIYNAKDYIHLEYFGFEIDGLGKRIIDALETKLKEGLEVKLLYDDVGSKNLKRHKFKHFESLGGEVGAFFASKLPIINFRMNNRNHRKIIVIDGQIGYIGGFNVGDDYLGLGKLGYWRDTHLRVQGDVVNALQIRFILDWNSQAHRPQFEYNDKYFPKRKYRMVIQPFKLVQVDLHMNYTKLSLDIPK